MNIVVRISRIHITSITPRPCILLLGCLLAFFAVACSDATRHTPKGHAFTVHREGKGKKAQAGDYMVVDMVFVDEKDSVWQDSHKQITPTVVRIPEEGKASQEEGIDEMLRMLREGDSVAMSVSAQLLFTQSGRPMPPDVDSLAIFTCRIGVKEVLDSAGMEAFRESFAQREKERQQEHAKKQFKEDTARIDRRLADKDTEAKKTASGLRYIVFRKGEGTTVQPGQRVTVSYAGYLLDGTLFDTNIEEVARAENAYTEGRPYEGFSFVVGQGQVIAGWDEMLLLMKKGEKVRVWIPSKLAYGPRQVSDVIASNSILVFDIEVHDIQ